MTAVIDLPRLTDADFRACLLAHAPGPGCAIAVLDKGTLAATFCTGLASVEQGTPITPQTVFRIASVTKQFLCAAVLTLVDDGKLGLEDPLGRHLPELQGVPATVTIRQAMSNTSGIRDHLELWYISGGGLPVPHRLADSVAISARQRETNFAPGSSYLYSNANFLLLSKIVAQTAGTSVEDYIANRFFIPLGMTRTRLRPGHHDVIEGLATGYVEKDGAISRGQMTTELWGEGSAHSTLEDLVTWARYLREDPDGLIARMRQPATYTGGETGFYGFGLFSETWRGLSTVSHTGLWPGYRAEIVWFDGPDLMLVCLTNLSSIEPRGVNRKLAERLLGAAVVQPDATLDPALWARGAGMGPFLDPQSLTMIEMRLVDGVPQLEMHGGLTPVLPLGPARFAFDAGGSEFAWFDLSDLGRNRITARKRNGETLTLTRLADLPEPVPLDTVAGRWWSDETQSRIEVAQTAAGYTVATPQYWGHEWVARPIGAGLLMIEDFTGPWPRRFLLAPQPGGQELVVAGPRVTRLVFRRAGD